MVIVDNKLRERDLNGNPIRIAVLGIGVMGKAILHQITNFTPGIDIVAVYDRTIDNAVDAYNDLGIKNYKIASSLSDFETSILSGTSAITDDINIICESKNIDLIVEATGTIEFASSAILKAFENGKHIVTINIEVDATLGLILKRKAKDAGVKYSVADGDQPGTTMNLYRFVKGIGLKPLLCGNIKGLQDHYRNPTTQKKFAAKWDMNPKMVTSFADGTKISFEQACTANAMGMKVAKRGMYGYHSKEHIDNLTHLYSIDELKKIGGIVDYVVGAKPGPGVFIYAITQDKIAKKFLKYVKLGDGPLYSFYTPYHLLFFELANSICRLVDFDDPVIVASDNWMVDVVATAKVDLKKGDVLDGFGGYKTYGVCENYTIVKKENLLPLGLADGSILTKDLTKDQVLTYNDVELPPGRLCDVLRDEQDYLQKHNS